MRRLLLVLLVCVPAILVSQAQTPTGRAPATATPSVERARNVILFVGDAGGLPTLNAASLYGYDRPQALFIQKMPNIALMDTSTASNWVTDSAAGMTAIVTGRKTHNGVLSQADDAVRGKKDGERLKTILEYAEERGLSTGVITNDAVTGATPAACYAHANNRSDTAGIIAQLGKPLAGNGVDLVLGGGRSAIYKATAAAGLDFDAMLRGQGYTLLDSPEALRPDTPRAVGLTDASDYDVSAVVAGAIGALSRNPKGLLPHGRVGSPHRRDRRRASTARLSSTGSSARPWRRPDRARWSSSPPITRSTSACAEAGRAGRCFLSRRRARRLRRTRPCGWTTGTRVRRSSLRRRGRAPAACAGSSRTRISSRSCWLPTGGRKTPPRADTRWRRSPAPQTPPPSTL